MLLSLALAGCTSAGKPAVPPRLEAVVPAIAFTGEETLLQLSGEAFTPKATARWGGTAGDISTALGFQAFAGDRPLAQVTWVDARTLTALAPAGLPVGKYAVRVVDPYGASTSLADALEVRSRRGAVLVGTLTVPAGPLKLREPILAQLELTNAGDSAAEALGALQLPGSGTAEVAARGVSQGKPTLGPGESTRFALEWASTRAGTVVLSAEARGVDARSGKSVRAGPLSSAAIEILPLPAATPAALTASFVTPPRVNAGQRFGWSLQVTNSGEAAATAVTPGTIALLGASPGVPDGGAAPSSQDVPGGASRSFSFSHTAGDAGALSFQAAPSGTDALDGGQVTAPLATSAIIEVQRPARLAGTLAIPGSIALSSQFTATLQATNTGQALAVAVTPSALAITGNATLLSGPAPASASIAADAGVTFTWLLSAGASGSVEVAASAAGTDDNDAAAITTGPLGSNLAAIGSEVLPLATDPFADGTSFAFVFSYGGKVWLGPRKTGFGAVSINPDGTGAANHSFAFARDVGGGASHANTSAAPYPSIGAQGCTINTPACGPNNENGRGLFFSQTILGVELLGVAGAHQSSKLEYVYLSADTGPTIDFRFVDVSTGLGGATRSLSAAHAFNDRLYLGFPDTGGNRPYLLALVSPVPAPGLNASTSKQLAGGADLLNLEGDLLPGLGPSSGNGAPTLRIDAIADFNDRLYLANNGGVARSTTNSPLGPGLAPADWTSATPSALAFGAKSSIASTQVSALVPADKAFPAIVPYRGRLYAARNTTTGPQLWGCDPGADGFCAPDEWALIAANSSGDLQLTQLSSLGNQSIGLLAATASTLFVGFNNPTGLQVFKTTAAAPSARADFTGSGGCVAGSAGCEGLGGNGLGAPAINRQIFDARALTFGPTSWLYLVTGNGTSGVRVWRIGG